jgi:hypothetical protein
MNLPGWKNLYAVTALAALAVCGIFWRTIGPWHLAAVLAIGVAAPLGLALLGGRLTHPPEPATLARTGATSGAAAAAFGIGLFIVAAAKYALIGMASSRFMPVVHDEWSYLFGAQTLALGRLSNPTPPRPEFFDAFHILTQPRWVTRYPPGHPAVLALGVLAGWPPLAVIAMMAGTVVWVYLLGREVGGEPVGRLAGVLALLAPGFDGVATGYLSQSTFLFAISGCYSSAARALRIQSAAWSAAAGALGGWAILTRPYSAIALGAPLAAWFLWQLRPKPPRANGASDSATTHHSPLATHMLVAAAPLAALLGFFAVSNFAATGSPWRMAWVQYNRQFEPNNTLGFASSSASPIAEGLSVRKSAKARSIAEEKAGFTWREAARRALGDPRRLSQLIFPALGFYGLAAFLPLGWRRTAPVAGSCAVPTLLAAGIAAHYTAYSFFYSTWDMYGVEPAPLLIVLAAAGLVEYWRSGRDSERPMLALVVPLAIAAVFAFECIEVPRFISRRRAETDYHRRFANVLSRPGEERAIVFVRLDPSKPHPYDLINNSPDLAGRVLVVLDLDERNAELLEAFPDRQAYLFDESNWSVTSWTAPPKDVPAKGSALRPAATLASLSGAATER